MESTSDSTGSVPFSDCSGLPEERAHQGFGENNAPALRREMPRIPQGIRPIYSTSPPLLQSSTALVIASAPHARSAPPAAPADWMAGIQRSARKVVSVLALAMLYPMTRSGRSPGRGRSAFVELAREAGHLGPVVSGA